MPRDPHEEDQGASQEKATSGELTDIFASLRPAATPSPAASSAQTGEGEGGFTALFSTRSVPAPAAPPPSLAPAPSEAPTQIFTALPHAPMQTTPPSAADQTVLFTPASHVVSASPLATPPAPPFAPPATPPASGEFTHIFKPLVPPSAATPVMQLPVPTASVMQLPVPTAPAIPAAAALPAPNGEFTQFFSAVSAREAEAAKPHAAPVASHTPEPASFPPANTSAPQPGAFTQLFQQAPPPAPASQSAPLAPAPYGAVPPQQVPPPAPAAVPQEALPPAPAPQPGAFTQMFSQLQPPTTLPSPVPLPPPTVAPAGPAPHAPIFGAPAPRGSFTDVFAAQSAPPVAGGSPSAGFTELFRPAAPVFSPAPAAVPPAAYGSVPASFAAPAGPPPAAAAGDFTRLMQSLERPVTAAPPVASLPVDAAFFNPVSAASGAESEYTRVLRGGGAVQGGFGAAAQAPVAGSAAAPGLALAPEAKQDAAAAKDKPAKDKPRPLVLLLVVMNVLLLLALIVIGILVLRHK